MPGYVGMATDREERKAKELPVLRKTTRGRPTKDERQCKERYGVEGAEGGRRERPEQLATTRTLQADHEREHGDTRRKYISLIAYLVLPLM